MVFGSLMSAMWILIANSFMQHPVGYEIINGRAQMTDFFALITNPQFFYEYGHVITGAITMGGILVAGMSAFKLLNKESLKESTVNLYKKSVRIGLLVSLIGSISVMGAGDLQMKALLHDQPMKFAAMEGDYEDSGDPAAWTVVAWANEAEKQQVFGIKVPYMLSILSYGKPSGSVLGMNTANKELVAKYGKRNYFPMVNLLFYSFRIMAGFGMLMFGVSALGLFLSRPKKPILFNQKWLLRILALTTFAPFIANTLGWIITEQGRYPWTVYGLFTIKDSVSPNVSVPSLLISNGVYFVLFSGLGLMMTLVIRELHKGPEYEEAKLQLASQASMDPFDKGAF
ncbi:cytochrome d ubiquinol oxidase, subunit I [Streptococcus ictaluri 707-05]|uniref:Cytochrome d ubiquinol oxidase, subunit I n=1 Tax=Streptococcus ictaluri 707-05 TaxID=764299 RepID=G5K4J2_9STRE|nr:cytochrome d ubiquinol oxidase, subunit I [Streptococcus ictaluri 707-05]